MHIADTWNTALKTKFWLYAWMVIPLGLTNAPATFMWLINDILQEHLGGIIVIFLDDILIFNKT